MSNLSLSAGVFMAMLTAVALPASAATFTFETVPEAAALGELVMLTLLLDTDGEDLNALSGLVDVTGPVEVAFVRTAKSVVGPWISEPIVSTPSGNIAQVQFAGIMPGGFDGVRQPFVDKRESGIVLTLYLRGYAPGTVAVALTDARVLRNDGQGTEASTTLTMASYTVTSQEGACPYQVMLLVISLVLTLAVVLYFGRRRQVPVRSPQARDAAGSDDATIQE